ncbi:MAG: S1C family serine protease [Candidatus Promineifilaceae bacterium]|jgi:S1-C subfamily serine protease
MKNKLLRFSWIVLLLPLLFGCARSVPTSESPPSSEALATSMPTPSPIIIVATPTPLGEDVLQPLDVEEQLVTNLYDRVGPSVVHITSRLVTVDFFYGPMPQEGTGSGFVYDNEGHIVTNFHVIEDADTISVKFSDNQELPAQVIGADPANDLAVLALEETSPDLEPLSLGSSDELHVGQRTIAIGNPFGLDRTLTTGVVSALGRPLQAENDTVIFDVIQTDAAINPGNSGGPLLNSRGQVIGINTAIQEDAQGIGFAVPVNTVKRIVPILIENGTYPHPWTGLLGYSITPDLADRLQLPVTEGILVAQLYQNGPAMSAGIHGADTELVIGNRRYLAGGDIITTVNDQPVTDWTSLSEYLELNTQVGEEVTFSLIRGDQQLDTNLVLIAQP